MVTYEVPRDGLELTKYVDKPQQAHCLIMDIQESPTKPNGEVMNAIRVRGRILASTVADQVGAEFSELLFNPNMASKDGGAFAAKVHLRLARACGILPQATPGAHVSIDWSQARGKQAFVTFAARTNNEGKEFVGFSGAHIYHVTDPEVATLPRDANALAQAGVRTAAGAAASAPVQQMPQQMPVQQQPQQMQPQTTSASQWDDV